jgi:hypothetical protein
LSAHRVNDVRQIEIHTAKLLVPDTSPFEVKIAVAKLKKYKSLSSNQIPAEIIQAGGEPLQSQIHELINSVQSKEELLVSGSSPLLYQFTRRGMKLNVVIIEECHSYQLLTKFIQYPSLKVKSIH